MRWWKSKRSKPRCYAKLDTRGYCLALWRLDKHPEGLQWIEVKDLDSRQIGLAADQLIPANASHSQQHRGAQQLAQRAPACSRITT